MDQICIHAFVHRLPKSSPSMLGIQCKWINSLRAVPWRTGLGTSQKLTWILQCAAYRFPLELLSFSHTNRNRKLARISVCEIGACISLIAVVEFNPINIFFTGGNSKRSYEFHSWKSQNSGAYIAQPVSQERTRCFSFILITAVSSQCRM